MAVTISSGWLDGSLPDDTGREWPVSQSRQNPTGGQNGSPVNLVLHTTETDHLVGKLEFPSNFQCGEGQIVQHIQLGFSGDAVFTFDRDCIGIEMVGRANLARSLPEESTLGPTVALVAWLHSTNRIKTGLKRPDRLADRPVVLDQLPAAVPDYYRRSDPKAQVGVHGHVDLSGGNSHWDPGSFDYPVFFSRVQEAMDMKDSRVDEILQGMQDYLQGNEPGANAPMPEQRTYKALANAASKPRPDATSGITKAAADALYAPIAHPHNVAGKTT